MIEVIVIQVKDYFIPYLYQLMGYLTILDPIEMVTLFLFLNHEVTLFINITFSSLSV